MKKSIHLAAALACAAALVACGGERTSATTETSRTTVIEESQPTGTTPDTSLMGGAPEPGVPPTTAAPDAPPQIATPAAPPPAQPQLTPPAGPLQQIPPLDSSPAAMATVERIFPDEAKVLADRGEAVFLDVRSGADYFAGHIQGALRTPEVQLSFVGNQLPRGKKLITYCT
jgi:hypothetical protein